MAERTNILFTDYDMIRNDFRNVFSACIGGALAVKFAAAQYMSEDWTLEFAEGVIHYGEKVYPIQFLGAFAKDDNSWLWGWENINEFNDSILDVVCKAKDIAAEWRLQDLTTRRIRCDELRSAANLSIVAIALAQGDYTYQAIGHETGAGFVAVGGLPEEVFGPVNAEKFLEISNLVIKQANVNHKVFLDGFAAWNGSEIEWSDSRNAIIHIDKDIKVELGDRMEIINIDIAQ